MEYPIYQVDAFSNKVFQGNPAAICPLDQWLDDALLLSIAAENNLSETAFIVKSSDDIGFDLRWFTPTLEVDLCGHATLASAYVIFNFIDTTLTQVNFKTRSGVLIVKRIGEDLEMEFPLKSVAECELSESLRMAFGGEVLPVACYRADDYILIYQNEQQIQHLVPDLVLLKSLDLRGVSVSAVGDQFDFVARFFAPNCGIDEDPVTGSIFTYLTPLWSKRLNRKKLSAKQISKRGGIVRCHLDQGRVKIVGQCVLYLQGVFHTTH